jgi:low temperature requirement protein LtrA
MHSIAAGHFAERHGLVIIVAIGESEVSIGVGFHGVHLGFGEILVAILGLGIAYYLWWYYFAGDDARAEHVLAETRDPLRRARLALQGWGYAHYPMLLGIVIASAAIKMVVGHAFEHLHWGQAAALGGGVALYVLGHAAFLSRLRLRGVAHRLVAAALILATIPLGHLSAIAQLAAIPLIMSGVAIAEDLPEVRRAGPAAIGDFGRGAD